MGHALRSSSARAHGHASACRQAVLVRSGRGACTSHEAVCKVTAGLPTQGGASWSSAAAFSARRGSTRMHAAEATTGQEEARAMSAMESVAVGGFRLEGVCDDATVRELIAAREARSWLFLESEGSAGPREIVEEEGVEYQALAVATPEHGTEEAAKELVEKLRLMPRPTVRLSEPSAVVALARALSIDGFLGNAEMSAWVMSKALGGQLRVRQLRDGNTATFTYLVYDQLTRAAAIIDPVQDQLNRDTRIISELDLDLKYIINTHCHDDHISSGTKLKAAFPGATTAISEASGAQADRKLQHQDRLALGRHDLTVLTTPGHTDGCICLHTSSNGGAVFTGDALHVRSCGHTYNMQDRCEALFDSIHRELFSLPPQTIVYPGHGEDECPTSTVGEEMQHSSRIHLGISREEFVEAMLCTAAPPSLPKGTLRRVVSANMLDGIDEDELVSAWLRPASSWPFSSVDD